MHTRHITIRGAHDIDAGIAFCRDYLPLLSQQHGFRGVTVSADREGGLLGLTSHWSSKEDLDTSESALGSARDEQLKVTGGVMAVESFELTTDAVARRPAPGNPVIVTRVSMDPGCVHNQITRFERELLPAIAAQRGFSCLRLMANRSTGLCVTGIVWQDERALKEYMLSMESQRDIVQMQGVRIEEISPREILFINVD